jgi:hypothetical protein
MGKEEHGSSVKDRFAYIDVALIKLTDEPVEGAE